MKSEEQSRLEMRNTPAGQFLWSMGRDYYDTESAARRVAEEAVERIAAMAPAATACHGLTIPPDVPPGALAALVDAAVALVCCGEDPAPSGLFVDLADALAPFTADPAPPVPPPVMKTGEDIRRDFPGASYVTTGKPDCYTCRVTFPRQSGIGLEEITGYGSTAASAEDTAWHGVKITLREEGETAPPVSPAPERKPYGYAIKTPAGYLARQGKESWHESEPVGWAVYSTPDHAQGYAPDGAELVPVYRD